MDTKLTIRLSKSVIDKAKEYASGQKRSLSRIIEAYLNSLTSTTDAVPNDEIQISSFVKSMSTGVTLPADLDAKKEYADYLSRKHQ